MHHIAVQRNLVGSNLGNAEVASGKAELPVCPKPRKPCSDLPEFLYPLSCIHSHPSHQGSSEILDMISRKNVEGRESVSTGCPPSCYCGSPPTRLENPVVHDAQFGHQPKNPLPMTRTNLSNRLGFTSSAQI